MSARVLVVEDDPSIKTLIVAAMARAGFSVQESESAESAWQMVLDSAPDTILLDWMLPGITGFQFLRRLRADIRLRDLPIVMLTARSDEVDKISALDAGADDYVTKPFSPRELVARVKAVLRRRNMQAGEDSVELGGLRLMAASRKATAYGNTVGLGPVEFRLLQFLMRHPERVHSRRQLISNVWGEGSDVEERTIDVQIRRLRRALKNHDCDTMVQTVHGTGYRFSTQPDN